MTDDRTAHNDAAVVRAALENCSCSQGVWADSTPFAALDDLVSRLELAERELTKTREAYTRLAERLRYATPTSLMEVAESDLKAELSAAREVADAAKLLCADTPGLMEWRDLRSALSRYHEVVA